MSFFGRLKAGLGKTASRLTETITSVVTKKKLDQATLDDLLDALVMADLGMEASEKLIKNLKSKRFNSEVTEDEIKETLAEGVAEILAPVAIPLTPDPNRTPFVVLMVGVNGSGKTTTAGKLAELWQSEAKPSSWRRRIRFGRRRLISSNYGATERELRLFMVRPAVMRRRLPIRG